MDGPKFVRLQNKINVYILHISETSQHGSSFTCDECGSVLATLAGLNIHRRTHGIYTPGSYECQTCAQKVWSKGDLKRHQMTHTGEKPYKCFHCGKRFTRSNEVNYHVMRRHGTIKPHQCPHCQRKYAIKRDLTKHIKSNHTS